MGLKGSEQHTHAWLQNQSALLELLAVDYDQISLTRLYTVSDKLFKHRAELEAFLGQRERMLFNLSRSIVLCEHPPPALPLPDNDSCYR